MKNLRVTHSIGRLDPDGGGTSEAVSRLSQFLAEMSEVEVALVTQSNRRRAIASIQSSKTKYFVGESSSLVSLSLGLPFRQAFSRSLSGGPPSLFHDHGIWRSTNHYVAKVAKYRAIPLVIQPHGMLEPTALSFRGFRKRLALSLFKRCELESAALFFVTSLREAESLRLLGLTHPLAVIPVGVEEPLTGHEELSELRSRADVRTALALGRIHPIKGLRNLVDAWSRLRPQNWRLLLAGPDEEGHLAEIMKRAHSQRVDNSVQYVGPVYGSQKAQLLSEANLLVLPSHSESFGIVVPEALSYGVPVVTTKGTPWQDIAAQGCGWWVEANVDGLTEALGQALACDHSKLVQMGAKARVFAKRFDWKTIASQTVEVYRWVLRDGRRPDCVLTN